jgi:methionyl-tRNA formyltransferase
MRVLFYGTPAFALPTLDALLHHHDVITVVTQPDRPAHRGQRLTAPPVKVRALAAGIPVLQPARVRDPGWDEQLTALGADVAIVVAFGQILPRAVLAAPRRGSINVHASILPRYRGAAPIAWAIMRGETETGITTFHMDPGMDTGDVLLEARTPIRPDETAGELAERLAVLGAGVAIETLAQLDTLTPRPQRHEDATLAPRLKKSDGFVDWGRDADEIVNVVRGCNPWPGATTRTPRGPLLTIWRARVADVVTTPGAAGALLRCGDTLAIGTGGRGAVLPLSVQAQNRRTQPWDEYLRGARLEAGALFTAP